VELPSQTEVAIVGAGFGGLGMAINLERAGRRDYVLLERAPDVGGTWWANSYPGCQCDVPSNLYSFSFARRWDWERAYPMQEQILEYLRGCARRFGVLERTRLETELTGAAWAAERGRWELETSRGPLAARVLVAAPGLLSEPSVPALPGLDSFAGTSFHTAAWNHDHDLSGRRLGVFGTGATAIQVVPAIREQVEKLVVFQRAPPWVIPHSDHPVAEPVRRLYRRVPALQKLSRAQIYAARELLVLGMVYEPRLLKAQELVVRARIRRHFRDPAMRRRLTPSYALGCKRILLSNEWYPALAAPNVELVTAGVAEVREGSILDADGAEHELDTLIFATGFSPSDPPIARRLRGAEGLTLSETWRGSPDAYLGLTVAGFPNLFLLYGPNTNLGHTSIVYMLESQIRYVMSALEGMDARGAGALEVRPEAQAAHSAEMQERLAGTVWNTGSCGSWYFDANGRNSIQWPGFTFEYRRRTRSIDLSDYVLSPRVVRRPAVAAG
jgi:cation diffusion facilitator CzcD-associated flavoprotein CzcO